MAANTTMSLFLPAPVFGAKVCKNVSDVQVRDSAGEPENVVSNAEADISTVVLRTVTDAV